MSTYPERLRISLADSLRFGTPFEKAWTRALEDAKPQPTGWGNSREGEGAARHGEIGPLSFARQVFHMAYIGAELPAFNVSALEAAMTETPRDSMSYTTPEDHADVRRIPAGTCKWGGKQCRRRTPVGQRFCAQEHQPILDAIREEFRPAELKPYRIHGTKQVAA